MVVGTSRTRDGSTSSSSAAICVSAVRMPWPSSTLPGRTSTTPGVAKQSQVSSRRFTCSEPGRRGLSSAADAPEKARFTRASPPPRAAPRG